MSIKARTVSFWLTLILFPVSYYCASVGLAWIDVYYLDHWERAFGKAGSFQMAVIFGPLLAVLALFGYSIGILLQKRIVLDSPARHLITVAIIAGVVSPVIVQVVARLVARLEWLSPGMIAAILIFIAIPTLATIVLLRLSYLLAKSSSSSDHASRP